MDLSFPLPLRRSKGLTLRQGNLNSSTFSIHGRESLGVTPPAGESRIAQTDSEEHDDQTQRSTDIQASGDNIVVLHPPTTPAVANELVEHETNTTPHKICEGSSRGNHACTAENQGSVQELSTALGPFASNNPDNGRQGATGEPEPLEASCLLYTSDAADDMQCVDLGCRRIIKKKKKKNEFFFFKQKTAYFFFSSRRRHTR